MEVSVSREVVWKIPTSFYWLDIIQLLIGFLIANHKKVECSGPDLIISYYLRDTKKASLIP